MAFFFAKPSSSTTVVIVAVVMASLIAHSFCSSQSPTDKAELKLDENDGLLGSGAVYPPDANCQIAGINYGCTKDGYCFKSCSISPEQGEYCYTTSSTTNVQQEPRRRCNRDDECSPIWDCAAACTFFQGQQGYLCASYGCEDKKCWAGCDLNQSLDDEWCFTSTASGNSSQVKTCANNSECRPNSNFKCYSNCLVNS